MIYAGIIGVAGGVIHNVRQVIMHLQRINSTVLAFTALSVGATAPAVGQTGGSNDRAEAIAAAGTPVRYHAYLKATQQRMGRLVAMTQNKSTGSVFISPAGPDHVRVRVIVSTSNHDGSALKWAIVPGRCGSNMVPIAPVERFPIIDIGGHGRGEMDRVLALTMPAIGQHHVNVYRGGTHLEHVLTCGNLTKLSG